MKKLVFILLFGICEVSLSQPALSQGTKTTPSSSSVNQVRVGAMPEKFNLSFGKYVFQNWQKGFPALSISATDFDYYHTIAENKEYARYGVSPKATVAYHVHPSAVITNAPLMSPTERKIVYWASRTGFGFLRRQTGTYATGPYRETSDLMSHATEPRRSNHSPR